MKSSKINLNSLFICLIMIFTVMSCTKEDQIFIDTENESDIETETETENDTETWPDFISCSLSDFNCINIDGDEDNEIIVPIMDMFPPHIAV